MWVCRPGKKAKYIEIFLENSSIYLTWENFDTDLSACHDRNEMKKVLKGFMNTDNRVSIANWAGQAYSFCCEMKIGDYVLIPNTGGREYIFAQIVGNYTYIPNSKNGLYHCRKIKILRRNISKNIFNQETKYSLGAFRTLFKVKNEEYVLDRINNEGGE